MIKVLNEEEMIKYLDELAEIYKLAIKSTDDSVNFLKERIKNSINSNLNTVIVVAMEDEKIVGFVYGFDFKPETWWAVQIAPSLPKEEFDWYENTFELNELMVLPEYQSKGYGKLLMNKIRDDFNYSRILLGTAKNNNDKVINFYKKLGYEIIVDNFKYPNDEYGTSLILCYR